MSRSYQKRLPRRAKRLLLLLAILLAAFLCARPAYHAFKKWRIEKNLQAAQLAAGQVRMSDARDLSLTVLRAGDPRIDAFRILQEAMGTLHDPRHVAVSRMLLAHPKSSDEDRLNAFRGIAPAAPLGVVAQAWISLPEHLKKDPKFIEALAQRLIGDRRLKEAASLLVSTGTEPESLPLRRLLIRVLIETQSEESCLEAQKRIAREWIAAPENPAIWTELLDRIPLNHLRPALLEPLLGALREEVASAAISPEAALALTRCDVASQPSDRETLIAAAIDKWKDPAPAALGAFLLNLEASEQLLEAWPEAPAAPTAAVLRQRLAALENTSRWEEIAPLLQTHSHILPRYESLARQAIAAHRLGNHPAFNQAWTAAVADARSSSEIEACLRLHKIGKTAGLKNESERALFEAIRKGRGPLPLYADLTGLLTSLSEQHRETDLLQICSIYFSFEPTQPVLLTQYTYLACLNDLATPDKLIRAIRPMAEALPNIPPIQYTLALLQLSDNLPQEAAGTLSLIPEEQDQSSPSYQAIRLTSRVLNGEVPPNDPRVTGFPWKSLLPSERHKFTRLIKLSAKEDSPEPAPAAPASSDSETDPSPAPAATGEP